MTTIPRTPDSVELIQVIETKTLRGAGTIDDPARIVTQFWSLDGELLADDDVHKDYTTGGNPPVAEE